MQHTLQVFQYENERDFRTIEIGGEIWFYGIDVCVALDIRNPSDAYARLDPDDLGQTEGVDKAGRKQSFRLVNESGLYSLILRSDKPEAKRFKRWITREVLPQIRKTGQYLGRKGRTPAFIRRYNENWDRVDQGHFSVISELAIRLWGRLEQVGHTMADKAQDGTELRPDVSVGKRFSTWLSEFHPDVKDNHSSYLHWTPQMEFPARQYPNEMLPLYIEYVDTVWIPECAEDYFKLRDPAALPYLPKLLPSPSKPKAGMMKARTLAKRR